MPPLINLQVHKKTINRKKGARGKEQGARSKEQCRKALRALDYIASQVIGFTIDIGICGSIQYKIATVICPKKYS